jgi:hypothetical protein
MALLISERGRRRLSSCETNKWKWARDPDWIITCIDGDIVELLFPGVGTDLEAVQVRIWVRKKIWFHLRPSTKTDTWKLNFSVLAIVGFSALQNETHVNYGTHFFLSSNTFYYNLQSFYLNWSRLNNDQALNAQKVLTFLSKTANCIEFFCVSCQQNNNQCYKNAFSLVTAFLRLGTLYFLEKIKKVHLRHINFLLWTPILFLRETPEDRCRNDHTRKKHLHINWKMLLFLNNSRQYWAKLGC